MLYLPPSESGSSHIPSPELLVIHVIRSVILASAVTDQWLIYDI